MANENNATYPQTTSLTFGQAHTALKSGSRVSREAWGTPQEKGVSTYPVWLQNEQAGDVDVFVQVSKGQKNTWTPNSVDLHANDYIILS
jgi:hypothetical protein